LKDKNFDQKIVPEKIKLMDNEICVSIHDLTGRLEDSYEEALNNALMTYENFNLLLLMPKNQKIVSPKFECKNAS